MKRKILFIPILFFIFIIGYTIADNLENGVRVALNSDLTYYLSVKYDGVDVFGSISSDDAVAEVYSDVITVTDQIPDGLIFKGFVVSEDGTIGAVRRDNSNIQCLGKVVDDTNESSNNGVWNNDNTEFIYHGLHYDANTRTVSFKVKNLKAGCVLNVGIKIKTPDTVDDPNTVVIEKRRDFYNYAVASESLMTAISNTVHFYIGYDESDMHTVSYQIEGEIPNGYVSPPTLSYLKGRSVSVDNNIKVIGYTFSGWSSNDVEIIDGSFIMPDSDVLITGSFSPLKYKLIYKFQGSVVPENSESLLPNDQEYNQGDMVTLVNIEDVAGYKFLGWNKEDTFKMPNEDVTVYGEWKRYNGEFEPIISISEVDGKDYYHQEDIIKYKITITNNEEYPINNVIIKENLDNVIFTNIEGYSNIDNIVTIDLIDANSSFDIYAEYMVTNNDSNTVTNNVELIGALADNYYELKDQEYSDFITSNLQSKLKICTTINGVNVGNSFNIKVYNNNEEYWLKLMHDECDILYINPGTYKIFEVLPQEYSLESISGDINTNNANLTVLQGVNYQVNFVNRFKSKKFMHMFGEIINRIEGGE